MLSGLALFQIDKHSRTCSGRANQHQTDPKNKIGLISGLGHIHSDFVVMELLQVLLSKLEPALLESQGTRAH